MFRIFQKPANNNGLTVKDFVEVRKRSLIPHLPNAASVKQKWTMYGLCVRFLDLLKARYGDLKNAIAAGEKGEAFVAQAIQKRDNPLGGICGWLKNNFAKAGFSHPTVLAARDKMEAMGVLAYDSNGRGNVGYTRLNIADLLILMAVLENDLNMSAEPETMVGDDQLTAEFWADYDYPENPIVAIAKVTRSRWRRFFGYNPRIDDPEYQYPTALEAVAEQLWTAISKIAEPVVNIPDELKAEARKYCLNGAKRVVNGGRFLERTLETEMAYQRDLDAAGVF